MKTVSFRFLSLVLTALITIWSCAGSEKTVEHSIHYPLHSNFDTVQSKKFDTGKMWTFEHAPLDYFEETYSFRPTDEWLEHVRLSTLKFANWCSASFVSEDGLILTNHHCVDFITSRFEKEGEGINAFGFYADSLHKERRVPNLFVDQVVHIEDVTEEILRALNAAGINDDKQLVKAKIISEIENRLKEETGLTPRVVSLYNGGKFSLYGYKRYNDVRAVLVLETDMGLWGGHPDNFTYPRYNPDFALMRAYDENGEPLKTKNFFAFNHDGPAEGEPLFVVGNPGSTFRLKTVAQLEYFRDFVYRNRAFETEGIVRLYEELLPLYPERADEFNSIIVARGNSAKVFGETYRALVDPYLMARKRDFEKKFKDAVASNPELNNKYGHIWDGIKNLNDELRKLSPERFALRVGQAAPVYFRIARNLIKLAKELELPEEQRTADYKAEKIDSTINSLFPDNLDAPVEKMKTKLFCNYLVMNISSNHKVVKNFSNGLTGDAAANYLLNKTTLNDKENVLNLVKAGSQAILNSKDPFIKFLLTAEDRLASLDKMAKEISDSEKVLEDELGRAYYEVYGTSIPPDATFTLRISDGIMKSYNYNGTVAPTTTTFYGMYDRYYSNQGNFPWSLTPRWVTPAEGFDPSTSYNFISTHDITGGSSGSPVINSNAEFIGIAFDGNIESIKGNIIFLPEENRMVSVSSSGMMQIIDYIAGAKRIAEELRQRKIPDEFRTPLHLPETLNENPGE